MNRRPATGSSCRAGGRREVKHERTVALVAVDSGACLTDNLLPSVLGPRRLGAQDRACIMMG